MHDTLKKLHQVILASLEVRFPDKFKDHSIDDNVSYICLFIYSEFNRIKDS